MLFHLGGIIRLNEMGHLEKVARVSSVSAGSITARAENLDELVVAPIRKLAGRTIDNPSII